MAVLVTQQVLKTTQYHQKPGRLLAKNLCKNNHFFLCPCFALVWSCKRSCAGHSPHPHHLMVQWRQVEFGRQVEERTRRLATAAIAHTHSLSRAHTLRCTRCTVFLIRTQSWRTLGLRTRETQETAHHHHRRHLHQDAAIEKWALHN